MGHIDELALITRGEAIATRPIDRDRVHALLTRYGDWVEDHFELGGEPIEDDGDLLTGLWYDPALNPELVDFALALHEATGCSFADVAHRRMVTVQELRKSIGVQPARGKKLRLSRATRRDVCCRMAGPSAPEVPAPDPRARAPKVRIREPRGVHICEPSHHISITKPDSTTPAQERDTSPSSLLAPPPGHHDIVCRPPPPVGARRSHDHVVVGADDLKRPPPHVVGMARGVELTVLHELLDAGAALPLPVGPPSRHGVAKLSRSAPRGHARGRATAGGHGQVDTHQTPRSGHHCPRADTRHHPRGRRPATARGYGGEKHRHSISRAIRSKAGAEPSSLIVAVAAWLVAGPRRAHGGDGAGAMDTRRSQQNRRRAKVFPRANGCRDQRVASLQKVGSPCIRRGPTSTTLSTSAGTAASGEPGRGEQG